jgi:hypothetical protein
VGGALRWAVINDGRLGVVGVIVIAGAILVDAREAIELMDRFVDDGGLACVAGGDSDEADGGIGGEPCAWLEEDTGLLGGGADEVGDE